MGNGPQETTQKWTVSGSTLTVEKHQRARHAEARLQEVAIRGTAGRAAGPHRGSRFA
jgi:hypothetical protein